MQPAVSVKGQVMSSMGAIDGEAPDINARLTTSTCELGPHNLDLSDKLDAWISEIKE
jgi:hypothetical protein